MSKRGRHHVPQRTCVACGRRRTKRDLLRFLRDGEGRVRVDRDQRGEGRGVYLCPEGDCLAQVKQARIQKALRCPVAGGAWNLPALAKELLPATHSSSRKE